MAWRIDLSTLAQKNLDQLDPQIARRILTFLNDRVTPLTDPACRNPSRVRAWQVWKYRVGDYGVMADVEDGALCILVVKIGNRREVYR